ncbi:uncharacterized protein LOC100141847 [Tribolium castaneum]|uniref:Uncharacterized protein n=1 Tax=Tribolium castaneum TaxID=7070 RepID=D6X019_TRICA|nr:PREDICTED: uncharacterized protein LOC100141847 [Tribolium castaneum]EFA10510.2 hypothetical protein TcasGA2_TC012761 [Tribolium castaneum]|eukprot:XP_001815648.1 PREDICTED: uncharacterized protein LOC100141847 [Tribolium castaneum]
MDQQTTPNGSGFVYFNTSSNQEYQNQSDTADFLAFTDTPQASPPTNKFKPAYYSSPQSKFHRGSPRQYPQNNRRYQRWSGGYNRSYNSSNSSFNQSGSFRESDQEGPNILKFIHPSFLEDPWASLEAKLKEKGQFDDSSQSGSQET